MRWRPWRPTSLRGRLVRDTLVAFLVAAAFYVAVLQAIFHDGSERLVHDGLIGQAEDLEAALRVGPGNALRLDLHEPMKWGYDAYFENLKYRILDERGDVLLSSEPGGQALARPGERPRLAEDFFRAPGGLHVATRPLDTARGRLYLQTARSDRFFELAGEAMLPVVVETSTAVGAIALLLFGLVIVVGMRRSLQPVRRASGEAEAINPRNLSSRISTDDMPAEIRPLVDGINQSLGRIEDAFQVQQRFLANAAHELKTPLAILRGQVELAADGTERLTLLREIDAMARTVSQLLQLAEASDVAGYRFGSADLHQVAEEALSMVRPLAAARGITFAVHHAPDDASVTGDAAALQVALRNLLENAIHHSPPGGQVDVRVDAAAVTVRDHGIGLDEEVRARMFERFWRRDRSGSGSGLGLALVKEIAGAHGAVVEGGNAEDGPGARFVLRFPAHAVAAAASDGSGSAQPDR